MAVESTTPPEKGSTDPRDSQRIKGKIFGAIAVVAGLTIGIGVLAGGTAATAPKAVSTGTTQVNGLALAAGQADAGNNANAGTVSLPKLVIIGDSLSTGYGTSADDAWPHLLSLDPNISAEYDVINASTNGSGYISVGDGESTFSSQIAGSVSADDSMVLFFGSENDMGNDTASVKSAALAAFDEAKTKAPGATLVVVGPPSYTNDPEESRLAVRDGVEQAALEAKVEFIDPIKEGWIMGNADTLIGSDGDHPSQAGQQYLEAKMESIVQSQPLTVAVSATVKSTAQVRK